MYRAELSLAVLQYIGMWQPKFLSQIAFVVYNIFSFFVITVTYFFTFTTLMYLFNHNLNLEEFTESFFFALALLCGSIKIGNLFMKRDEIIELTDMLFDERFIPRDIVEVKIQNKFDKISRLYIYIYILLT